MRSERVLLFGFSGLRLQLYSLLSRAISKIKPETQNPNILVQLHKNA